MLGEILRDLVKLVIPGRLMGGILLGIATVGVTIVLLAGVITTEQSQTGYRGTGMVNFVPAKDIDAEAVLAAYPEDEPPYVPEPDAPLVKDLDYYENVQVLGNLTEDNFNRLMLAITNWVSPEQGCAYCHGEDGNFAHDNLYTKVVSRRMIQMTQHINENWGDHVGQVGVNCYTCHRGMNVPQAIWFKDDDKGVRGRTFEHASAEQNIAGVASTSLPRDPFSAFLVGDVDEYAIRVQDLGPRVSGSITEGEVVGTKQTEWTYSLMHHMSTSLGVNCTYCHNSRAWGDWSQSPPVRTTAWYGIRMVRDLNNVYLDTLQPVYPEHRLGGLGDAPKAYCTTCHLGVNQPMYGMPMVENWPELATTEAPVYEEAAAE